MAPEVARTTELGKTYGQQADVWSLGISLFMLLTQQDPHEENDVQFQVKLGQVSWRDISIGTTLRDFLQDLLALSLANRPRMHSLLTSGMSEVPEV